MMHVRVRRRDKRCDIRSVYWPAEWIEPGHLPGQERESANVVVDDNDSTEIEGEVKCWKVVVGVGKGKGKGALGESG